MPRSLLPLLPPLLGTLAIGGLADPMKTLVATEFVKYHGSDTGLKIQGMVMITTSMTSEGTYQQTMRWDLTGADDACPTGSGNVCGIHIHEVASCDEDAGGHFYNMSADPWTSFRYSSTGGVSQGTATIVTGLSHEDIAGKSLIVHSSEGAGTRVACSLLAQQKPLLAEDFVKYHESPTSLDVEGVVVAMTSLDESGDYQQTLTWRLQNVDDACAMGSGNVCGIHIHEVASCDEDAGGHLYGVAADPWTVVRYDSTDGLTTGTATVVTGLSPQEIAGKSIVVHDSGGAGDRVACALLFEQVPLIATNFVKYYDSNTDMDVQGIAIITTGLSDDGIWQQTLTWSLTGTDDSCPTWSMNQCGIHIHEVASCDEGAGSHFYNVTTDPWTEVRYASVSNSSSGSATVVSGVPHSDILGKSLIVHTSAYFGEKVACALLMSLDEGVTSTSIETFDGLAANGAGGRAGLFFQVVVLLGALARAGCSAS